MTLSYAEAHDLLESYRVARTRYDGDAWTALFREEGELVLDPFEPPLVGHNALRAYLLEVADAERSYELVIERHWVSGDTALAAWHASWNLVGNETDKVRQAAFLSAEVGEDGRIARVKLWPVTREHRGAREGA